MPARSRIRRLLRGPEADPRWARPVLFGLLALTALLYLWDLGRNGWANDFYAAAVQAGTKSWKAFFFGSFDSSNFITVDKTPASLWVMELSARIFGFNKWSMLVPQALEGVGSVLLLYAAVRRWFGHAAGLIAGLVLALTPVAALMFRFNNPDALLVLLMTAAAYAIVRAIENGRTKWLVFCGVLLGFAFLAKMLQAFLVLPGIAIAYLWAGPPRLGRRIWQTVLLGFGVIAGAGWWVLIAQLTPAADRPYFGGSTNNNILQLAIGYNGLGRLDGNETGSVGGGTGGVGWGGATGLIRLFQSEFGGQISWLLPAALIALAAMVWMSRRAVRTDRIRAAALLWGGWVLITGLVFSYMSGIIHPYYMVALAPGIGALVGVGAMEFWRARLRPRNLVARAVAAAAVVITAVWAYVLLDRTPDWLPWLRWVVLAAGVISGLAVLAGPRLARPGPLSPLAACGCAAAGGTGDDRRACRAGRLRAGHRQHHAHRGDPERGTADGCVRRAGRRTWRPFWREARRWFRRRDDGPVPARRIRRGRRDWWVRRARRRGWHATWRNRGRRYRRHCGHEARRGSGYRWSGLCRLPWPGSRRRGRRARRGHAGQQCAGEAARAGRV